jgi:hypothetical protein
MQKKIQRAVENKEKFLDSYLFGHLEPSDV